MKDKINFSNEIFEYFGMYNYKTQSAMILLK